uniref:Secreted protein n=1 Tax=Heterorhabditis bacteriophora TaxID=37862 RepID=A0A1I7XGV0_HETBA
MVLYCTKLLVSFDGPVNSHSRDTEILSNLDVSLLAHATCTRQAQFTVNIDGAFTTATCTAKNANPSERCFGCCQARALAAGLLASSASGFPSTNGYDCVCCFNKNCRK